MDIRCKFCNWLMTEVQNNFLCSNCGKENTVKEEVEEIEIKKPSKIKVVKDN